MIPGLLALAGCLSAPSVGNPALQVSAHPTGVDALSSDSPRFIEVYALAPRPGGGFLAVESVSRDIYRIAPDGAPALVEALRQPTSGFARARALTASDQVIAVFDLWQTTLQIATPEFDVLRRFPGRRFYADGGLAVIGDVVYAVGFALVPIDPDPGLLTDDTRAGKRRYRKRDDCPLFRFDWRQEEPVPELLVCEPRFEETTARLLNRGYVVASPGGTTVAAVLESKPSIYLFVDGVPAREVSYLEGGEGFFDFTDIDRMAQRADHDNYWRNRDRHHWLQGLLIIDGKLGLVFRRWDSDRKARFVVDLFDFSGRKLADDLSVPIAERGHRTRAYAVNAPGGGAYLLVQEWGEERVSFQKLYQVKLLERSSP